MSAVGSSSTSLVLPDVRFAPEADIRSDSAFDPMRTYRMRISGVTAARRFFGRDAVTPGHSKRKRKVAIAGR